VLNLKLNPVHLVDCVQYISQGVQQERGGLLQNAIFVDAKAQDTIFANDILSAKVHNFGV
jgi:hypothetical protein